MRLNQQTDYGLRTLMYLVTSPRPVVEVSEVASAYGISLEHLRKVVQKLVGAGWVVSKRGRGGGISLAVDPLDLTVGEVVRRMEPDFAIVECMGSENQCVVTSVCALAGVMVRAQRAFLHELDGVTLAECAPNAFDVWAILSRGATDLSR